MWKLLPVITFSVVTACAQTPGYFPLQVGNSWTYAQTDSRFRDDTNRTISVEGKETIRDREYFKTDYFGKSVLLRANPDGTVVQYDTESGTEKPWISLGGAVGSRFPAGLEECTSTGRIESRTAKVTTPAGSFSDLVQVRFEGRCADAGTTEQFWAAGVGLVSHEETSFAGPRHWVLAAFRPAAANAAPEISFTIGIDSPHYTNGETMNVRLTLASTHETQLPLRFPSGQSFDLKLYNESGESVYTWSATRLFAMGYRQETFGPGTRNYAFTVPVENLPPGRYVARGWLTTDPLQYAAEIGFRVVDVRANDSGAKPAATRRRP